MAAWNRKDGDFRKNLLADERVRAHLSEEEITSSFDPSAYLKNIDFVFERVGI